MRHFPAEFGDLLSPFGRKLLTSGSARLRDQQKDPGWRFLSLQGLISARKAEGVRALLERALRPKLRLMELAIPQESIWGLQRNYEERLPKTVRVSTAELDDKKSPAVRTAERLGLLQMLRSESFFQLAQRLSARPLLPNWGLQALRYGEGDYSGPHTDHHPEDAEAEDGYFDLHLSFSSRGVTDHSLVYERRGHFTQLQKVNTQGGVTAYRLPFWHFTTPLTVKKGSPSAHRWVLLGTFLYPKHAPTRQGAVRSARAHSPARDTG